MSLPDPLIRLIEQLQRLPGIGPKGAQRLAFHILRTPREDTDRLVEALREVKDRVAYCSVCSNITDVDPCAYCSSAERDHRVICVVEEPRDEKDRVAYCSVCSNITDVDPCAYCSSAERDHRVICVVEEPQNVGAIEKTREFKGVYHVLMGALSPLQGIGPDDLKIKGLLARVGEGGNKEVILATNPNIEGEAT